MISDAEIAALCAGIYAYPGQPGVVWDHYDAGESGDRVCWALKRVPGTVVLVFRGSVTWLDWLRDLTAIADPFHHDDVGPVHPGFLSGMRTVERELGGLVSKDEQLVIAGHSLGAGRAAILTGLLVVDGWKPLARVVFGEPKPGFAQLGQLIAGVPGRSYRNGDATSHDLVTDVPFSMPPEEYVHPTPIIPVVAKPVPGLFGQFGAFAWHHMPLYQQALQEKTNADV